MVNLILIFSFFAISITVYQISKIYLEKNISLNRLKKYLYFDVSRREKKIVAKKEYNVGIGILSKTVRDIKFLEGYKKRIQGKLLKANVLLKAEEYITFALIICIVLSFLVFIITKSIFFGMIFGIIGLMVPGIVISMKIKKRLKCINEQLGDTINLVSNSLKAGYSFLQALDIVGKEMSGPIAEEFITLIKEINLGQTYEKALENLVNRVSSDDLELLVTAVLIQRQIGGNLAEILDNISTTIRERVKIKGEIKTVTAQGRMSGIVIAILPVLLCGILFLINPEHITTLFTDPFGIALLVCSIIMELLGILFIKKIVNIEV